MMRIQQRDARGGAAIVLALLIGLTLAACGSASRRPGVDASAGVPSRASGATVVVHVGDFPLTRALYNHWMVIGAATVEMPKRGGALPAPVAYEPPRFTACIAHLQADAPTAMPLTQFKAECRKTYASIQSRILSFLITGYWLRGEAAEQHVSVSEAAVRGKFEEEKRVHFPTAATFRRFQEASRQKIADLMFAVETQMLSARLLEKYTKTHHYGQSERAAVKGFNGNIRNIWTPKTSCQSGYIVPDCRQYLQPSPSARNK